jgi:ribosomal protein L37AE/L43A
MSEQKPTTRLVCSECGEHDLMRTRWGWYCKVCGSGDTTWESVPVREQDDDAE